jgi:hypothetical protein
MMKRLLAEMKTQFGSLAAKMDAEHEMIARMMASEERMMAKWDSSLGEVKAYEKTTKAFLEKKEPAPEETEAVAEPQEVPEGATDEETIEAAKDRSRNLRLALGYRGQLKTRTKHDGGSRQECAAAVVGRPTRRTAPAMHKGHVRKGPGKKCRRSGIRGQSKASRDVKRRRTRPGCNSGIKDRGMKQRPHLGRGNTFIEALGQTFKLEVVERTVGS